ncbi:hypothetical protein FOMA001_g18845 [Fusarium oxysporum f. sp. matthiolae]|nr:hypothetical protein FOMA001_g18845 [Fusarium oxysporum f. sp. matthiolae]
MLFQLCERTGTTDFSGAKKEFDSATQRDRQSESIDPNNTCFVAGPVGSFCSYRQGTFVIRDLLGTICTARPVCFLLSAAGLAALQLPPSSQLLVAHQQYHDHPAPTAIAFK